jgi:hypothetical protein
LPGIVGLRPIQITARNAGGGVIAYQIDDESLTETIKVVLGATVCAMTMLAIQAEFARAQMMPGWVTTIGLTTGRVGM